MYNNFTQKAITVVNQELMRQIVKYIKKHFIWIDIKNTFHSTAKSDSKQLVNHVLYNYYNTAKLKYFKIFFFYINECPDFDHHHLTN